VAVVLNGSKRHEHHIHPDTNANHRGVAEYWVVDVEGRRVVTYREPTAKGYSRKAEFQAPDVVTPQAFPGVKIVSREIFGDAA
jgi:Uma2 family endonuclease